MPKVMFCVPVSNDIRRELARLAKFRGTRNAAFTKACPTDWAPTQVIDPATNQPFTEDSAWVFVVAALENDGELEEMILDKPPGKKGYVMQLKGCRCSQGVECECTLIYVKLQLGSGQVIGRSFHLSKVQSRRRRA